MSSPNTSFNKTSNRSDDIDKEVANLLKKSDRTRTTYNLLEDLKTKYKEDEIVDSIMKKYNEKLKRVRHLAEKIKDRLLTKYPNLSMKEYIEKIADYKRKYEFDDSEMQAIINSIFSKRDPFGNPEALDVNYNEMSKALGFIPASFNLTGKLNLKKDDFEYVQNLLTLAGVTKELHNQVILQHFVYNPENDIQIIANSEFDRQRINIFSYVHPVVVALFLPKFRVLDSHMLLAGIAEIIQRKQDGQEIMTQPEYELYWDIATDPAETACVTRTKPFADLVNRANVQTKLWEAVLNLRQGKIYLQDHLTSFITAIDACRASVFDAADLAFVKDEGTIMRKLLAAFSLRPTIVLTSPVYAVSNITSNIPPIAASHITTLSMITVRIPMSLKKGAETVSLDKALSMEQLYIHHRQLTIKEQSILYSRELLIFYVHRRTQSINAARLTNPYSISYLPLTMNQFERLIATPVVINGGSLTVGSSQTTQTFNLISAIIVSTQEINVPAECETKPSKVIIGCKALIKDVKKSGAASYYEYDPLAIKLRGSSMSGGTGLDGAPVPPVAPVASATETKIRPFRPITQDVFLQTIQCEGTLLIFNTADAKGISFPLP
jgi:hypothetical protein